MVTLWISAAPAAPPGGEFRLSVVDEKTQQPLACRLHLTNARGLPQKAAKQPFLRDHFVFEGQVRLTLREGNYRFVAECGPEYHTRVGHFTVGRFASDRKTITMRRFVDMAGEGWWSGDMYVRRDPRDLQLLMRAEDLYVAQLVTWPHEKTRRLPQPAAGSPLVKFDNRRYYHPLAGRDARAGGGLCYYQLEEIPPQFARGARLDQEFPSSVEIASQLKQGGEVWVEADMAGCWDLPLWVAHDLIDSVRLADQRFGRDRFFEDTSGQRPRDAAIYGGGNGAGRWSEYVYYQLLNCGLRIPPTGGSGSGDVPNPLGHNRVYAFCGDYFSYPKWWEALRAGRVVVTNGPLLRPFVEGHPPGHVFRADPGAILRLNVELQLATKEKVEYLELIKNGELAKTVRLDEYVNRQGRLPTLDFKTSGWFLVRAVTEVAKTYRFATSGPFYVQFGSQPRCSRRAAEFFTGWVEQRAAQIEKMKDQEQREQILGYHRHASQYWQQRVETANAD